MCVLSYHHQLTPLSPLLCVEGSSIVVGVSVGAGITCHGEGFYRFGRGSDRGGGSGECPKSPCGRDIRHFIPLQPMGTRP